MQLQILGGGKQKRNIANEAYQAALPSPHLPQRQ
jgi:hypothetical protein